MNQSGSSCNPYVSQGQMNNCQNSQIYGGDMVNYTYRSGNMSSDIGRSMTYETNERYEEEQFKMNLIEKYKEEIAKLKVKNITLQNQNKILLEELGIQKEKQKKADIANRLVSDIMISLNVSDETEIIPKLNEFIGYLQDKQNSLNDEFIQKLQKIYLQTTGNPGDCNLDNIDLNALLDWVTELLKTLSKLSKANKQSEKDSIYKSFCEETMRKYHLKNLNELKEFINGLMQDYNVNRRRVEKLKDVLTQENSFGSFNKY